MTKRSNAVGKAGDDVCVALDGGMVEQIYHDLEGKREKARAESPVRTRQ